MTRALGHQGRIDDEGSITFVIHGEPVSHKNGYHIVTMRGRPAIVKSSKALRYAKDAHKQLRALSPLLAGPVAVTLRMFYSTERPDLDESLLLDTLQGVIYSNDRQVREKHVYHAIDRANPRAEITVKTLTAQQAPLL